MTKAMSFRTLVREALGLFALAKELEKRVTLWRSLVAMIVYTSESTVVLLVLVRN